MVIKRTRYTHWTKQNTKIYAGKEKPARVKGNADLGEGCQVPGRFQRGWEGGGEGGYRNI